MMEKKVIAQFTVQITSAEGATWQGSVAAENEIFHFRSELQLLNWLLERCPELRPGTEPK